MDPFSHGLLGASFTGAIKSSKPKLKLGLGVAFLSAMAPDLDVVIQAAKDPLLHLEYHRSFTHSYFFIPLGALICALFFYFILRRKQPFKPLYLFSFLGYGTHALLDACTSYGTQLYWPFSNSRVAWNSIGIIDPLFTFPLLFAVIWSYFRKQNKLLRIFFIYALLYLSFGFWQKQQVANLITQLAQSRGHTLAQSQGHTIEKLFIAPTPLNLFLWRSVYQYQSKYYVDAISIAPWRAATLYEGNSVEQLNLKNLNIPKDSQLEKDIYRFNWFASGWIYMDEQQSLIADLRYSLLPHLTTPMWGIEIDQNKANEHVSFKRNIRNTKKLWPKFKKMIWGLPIQE